MLDMAPLKALLYFNYGQALSPITIKMESFVHFGKKTKHLLNSSCSKLASFYQSCCSLLSSYFHALVFRLNPFWVQLHYFIIISLVGYLALKVSKPRTILGSDRLKYKFIKCYVVLCYLLAVHVSGYSLISLSIILVPSASQILKNKGLSIQTFSVFTTVSTFANGGFIPANKNMMVFIKNSGLLLLLIPQVLLGNILFATCLRFVIWALERVTKREEFSYILKSHKQLGYGHLLSCFQSLCLTATTFGLILVQFILFCSMEWTFKAMEGLNYYQKLVGSLLLPTQKCRNSTFFVSQPMKRDLEIEQGRRQIEIEYFIWH